MFKWIRKLYLRWKFRKLRPIIREQVNPDIERQFESDENLYRRFDKSKALPRGSWPVKRMTREEFEKKHPEWFVK